MPNFLARALLRDWVLASIGEVGKRIYCALVDLPVEGALSWNDAHAAAVSNRNEPLVPEGGHRRLVDLLPPKLGVILDIGAGQGPEDLLPARDLFLRYRSFVRPTRPLSVARRDRLGAQAHDPCRLAQATRRLRRSGGALCTGPRGRRNGN